MPGSLHIAVIISGNELFASIPSSISICSKTSAIPRQKEGRMLTSQPIPPLYCTDFQEKKGQPFFLSTVLQYSPNKEQPQELGIKNEVTSILLSSLLICEESLGKQRPLSVHSLILNVLSCQINHLPYLVIQISPITLGQKSG